MKPHDWHTLFAFGLLATALAVWDKRVAMYTIGIASAVIVVKHSDIVTHYLVGDTKGGKDA